MIKGKALLFITILLAAAVATVEAVRASPPAPLEVPHINRDVNLLANAETWSQTICLGDLIEDGWLKSRCAIDRHNCCRWNLDGKREKTLKRAEIQAVVNRIDLGGFEVSLKGPEELSVTQSHRELADAEIKDKVAAAATAKFGGDGSVANVKVLYAPTPVYVALANESAWDVALPETLTEKMTLRVISTQDENQTLGWVQASLTLLGEAYSAKKIIKPGDTLRPEDFEIRKTDILVAQASGQIVLKKGQFPESVKARQTIARGAPLTTAVVERIPILRLGDAVTLVLRSDSLRVSTKGVAQGSAAIGDMVTVQLSRYNRTFRGRLLEDHTVEVWL